MKKIAIVLTAWLLSAPNMCLAADSVLQGASLAPWWGVPFAGLLLSIALLPLITPSLWHHHFGKIVALWVLMMLAPLTFFYGTHAAVQLSLHAMLDEFIPFIIFIGVLYVVAGGIYIRGSIPSSPLANTLFLGVGALLASVMGTTGASMLLIRPLLRINQHRDNKVHTVIFFIFIVSNAGGALTPLGDPPLFLGFLRGVDFFWTVKHMALPTAFLVGMLLVIYFLVERVFYRRDLALGAKQTDATPVAFGIQGGLNFLLLGLVIAVILLVTQHGLRNILFVAIAVASLLLTSKEVREANHFSWAPMIEVGKLFFGIFITMAPVLLMLQAGSHGAFGGLVKLVTNEQGQPINAMYFWLTGALSSFLDNAPTYLVFFNLAGGDPQQLMGPMAATLMAISAGAVFMGANSYIGNAPNFMVKAIAESRGVSMPSFFGYMLWSTLILLPLFVVMTFLFF